MPEQERNCVKLHNKKGNFGMEVQLKKIRQFVKNSTREKWLLDPIIKRFLNSDYNKETGNTWKPAFIHNFEIYSGKKLIGDIKVFGSDSDFKKKVAQILIVIGENRGQGVGTKAIAMLLEKLKDMFGAVYCNVNRYNIASLKMLRKNGFFIKDLKGNEFVLYKPLV
jgi:RimJ/RimL family protein N-acetyltransferase